LTLMCAIEMNPKELQTKLQDEDFCVKLLRYLESVVKLDFDWADEPDEVTVYGRDKASHPSYQFPDYDTNIDDDEGSDTANLEEWLREFHYNAKSIAVATQTHRHTATCRKREHDVGSDSMVRERPFVP